MAALREMLAPRRDARRLIVELRDAWRTRTFPGEVAGADVRQLLFTRAL